MLCRCTGYRKIVEAVLAVAAGAVVDVPAPAARATRSAAARRALDAPAKVTGAERFGADALAALAGAAAVLTMRVVRSPHAHARFELGDLAALRARWPGLVDVLTAADVPNNAFAIFPDLRDQPVLADGVARFRGEAVLALVGDAATRGGAPRRRDADPLRAACRARDAAPTRSPPPSAASRCTRATPTTCSAAAASCAATSTPRSPAPRIAPSATFETRHVEHAYIEPEAG